jgi:hypothetical protein
MLRLAVVTKSPLSFRTLRVSKVRAPAAVFFVKFMSLAAKMTIGEKGKTVAERGGTHRLRKLAPTGTS